MADEVEEWLSIQFDASVQSGRDVFLSTVKASELEWPWSAITPVTVDWSSTGDELAGTVRKAPPALVLLLLRSVDNPELLGPDNYLDDEAAAGPLRAALEDWSPDVLKILAGEAGWSAELPTPQEPQEPQEPDSGDAPPTTAPKDPGEPQGQPTSTPPGEGGKAPNRAWWQRWETWAAVGVVTAAVGTAAYYRRRE